MFQNLNIKSLRTIRLSSKIENKNILIRNGLKFKFVYLVINGVVNIYNTDLKRVNYFAKDEL